MADDLCLDTDAVPVWMLLLSLTYYCCLDNAAVPD